MAINFIDQLLVAASTELTNSDIIPSNADLSGADLSGADLSSADMSASDAPAGCAGCLSGDSSFIVMLLVYGGLFFLLWFFMIRPQKKKRQEEEEMRKNVEVGDEITTIGGICGRVVSIKDDDSYIIETGAEKNKMKIMRWAILQNNTIKEAQPVEDTGKKGFFDFLKK